MILLRLLCVGPGGVCRPTLLARVLPLPLVSFVYKSTIARQLGILEPPKKPITPYLNFMVHSQADIQRKHPELSYRERIYTISQIWNKFDAKEKNKWVLEYKKQKEEYNIKYNNYIKNLSSEQIQNIKDLNKDKIVKKKWKRYAEAAKSERKEPDVDIAKPKSPGNAFTIYIRTLNQGKITLKEFMFDAASKWVRLSDEERHAFREEAKKLQEQYNCELAHWEQKMRMAGRDDLIHNHQQLVQLKASAIQDNITMEGKVNWAATQPDKD